MKEIFIDINDYNKSFISATENDNNSDIYKIIITEDARRFDLTGKTVQMAYAISYTDKGDILNLNVTNPTEGEITLEITNELTRKDGDYTCQLLILGENEYRRHSKYYFNLSIRENLFNKISGEIIESPNIGILQELVKKSEFLNIQLENNNNVAEGLNNNLSENINLADPLNSSLGEKIPEATVKKTELEKSITKAKEFINGLDGSQDIPGIRMELTELQNGLKSNQALSYEGSSISANDTLEGRTEGMRISGRTLKNEFDLRSVSPNSQVKVSNGIVSWTTGSSNNILSYKTMKLEDKQKYTLICNVYENTLTPMVGNSFRLIRGENYGSAVYLPAGFTKGIFKTTFTVDSSQATQWQGEVSNFFTTGTEGKIKFSLMIIKGDVNSIPEYFEGLKSFGESEQEGDKYKISILSHGQNICEYLESGSMKSSDFTDYNSNKYIRTNYINIKGMKILRRYLFNYTDFITKGGWYFYNKDKKAILPVKYGDSISVPSDACFVRLELSSQKKGDISSYITKLNFMVSEGQTNQELYTPYKCDKKDILIKEPLRGFDENTCDVMYEDNGQVKVGREVGKYTFTGEEGWTLGTRSSGWGEFDDTLVFYLDPFKAKTNTRFICDKFAYKNVVNIDEVGIYNNVWGNKPHPAIRIKKSELSTPDLEGFKSWLKTNPTTMIYQLAEPTIEIIENCVDIDLDTYQEKTYFNILNSLSGTLDFKVPSNIGSVVQNMAKEVNNIWDVINNLLVPGLMDAKKNIALKTIKNNLK